MGSRPSLLGRFVSFYVRSAVETRQLTPFYRRLTTGVAILGTVLGLCQLIPYMVWSRTALGLPLGEASLDGIRLQFLCWILGVLMAIPIFFISCTVLLAGLLSMFLSLIGRMSRDEAIRYTFLSRYPDSWFPSGHRRSP